MDKLLYLEGEEAERFIKKAEANERKYLNDYVCYPCGLPYLTEQQTKMHHVHTYHLGECAICGHKVPLTHKRAFNYLRWNANS